MGYQPGHIMKYLWDFCLVFGLLHTENDVIFIPSCKHKDLQTTPGSTIRLGSMKSEGILVFIGVSMASTIRY
jgi:hypothetical protein